VYELGWLSRLLEPFSSDPACGAVTGETQTPLSGPYALAASFTWAFPRYSNDERPVPARYYAHPAALRRSALERCPLPEGLPLVRGQGIVHSLALRAEGFTIWRHPQVRTLHPLPGLAELLARFFWQGHDSLVLGRLVGDPTGAAVRGFLVPPERSVGRVRHLTGRARDVLAEDPRRTLWLPLAVPVAGVFALAYLAGRVAARLAPHRTARSLVPGHRPS